MNLLYTFGAIGGILVVVEYVVRFILAIIKSVRKYRKMKMAYEKEQRRKESEKIPMGFMTEKERTEIQDRLVAKKGS